MNKIANWVTMSISVILISMLTACASGEVQTGRVAVIDLDVIAVATGKSEVIRDALTELVKQRESEITTLKGVLAAKVDAEKAKLGKKPSTQEQQSFNDTVNKARQELSKRVASAKQETQKFKLKLIDDFKQEILPVAVKIATKKNFSVVLLKGPNLFYVEAGADITQAVIAELNVKVDKTAE